jgi:toxin HigB-1
MITKYRSRQIERVCLNPRRASRDLGARVAEALSIRLDELEAVDCLADMRHIAHSKTHELSGDRAGQLACYLSGKMRLVFVPDFQGSDYLPDQGASLEWERVTSILIVEVYDYHANN